jgi:hypothetical protein
VGDLGDGDLGAGESSDLGDLGSGSAAGERRRRREGRRRKSASSGPTKRTEKNEEEAEGRNVHDASNHVRRNRDVLGPHRAIGGSSSGSLRSRLRLESSLSLPGSSSDDLSTNDRSQPSPAHRPREPSRGPSSNDNARDARSSSSKNTRIPARARVVEHGSLSSLPVLEEASSDLGNGDLDGVGRALDLDDSLGRLRKHLLGGDHSSAGDVLNVLDLEAGATDHSAHEVVGDEEADGGEGVGRGRREGVGRERGLEELAGDLGVGLEGHSKGNEGVMSPW